LEKACIVLLGDISPSVAVALIEQADKHRSKQLIEKCFEVIDAETDGALSADSLTRLTKESLKRVVERSQLSPSDEIMIFRAVCAWAEAECARQGDNSPTPEKKRQVLGDVFNAVRFPTMSVEEFGEVGRCKLINCKFFLKLPHYLFGSIISIVK
uniref:BACK domain-containing protein n=1 Tax=Anisakis simplex TaxID=6269 RepID=A0A0M3J9K3_ANISI